MELIPVKGMMNETPLKRYVIINEEILPTISEIWLINKHPKIATPFIIAKVFTAVAFEIPMSDANATK